MLQQFSWTQFLIYFAVFSGLWYLGLFATVYRKDVLILLGKAQADSPGFQSKVSVPAQQIISEDDLMGKSKLPEGLEVVGMEQIAFSSENAVTRSAEDEKFEQLGLVSDVLSELKEVFSLLATEDGTKNDFLEMVTIINEKYGRIGSNPNIGQINAFIQQHAPFAISATELDNLWH